MGQVCMRIALSSFALLLLSGISNGEESPVAVTTGYRLERSLAPGDSHVYTAQLNKGWAIDAEADQEGVDLKVDIYDPTGKLINTVDSPNGTQGPEPIAFTAREDGVYKFVIHTFDSHTTPGKYLMKVNGLMNPAENAKRIARAMYRSDALFDLSQTSRGDVGAIDKFIESRKGRGVLMEPIKDDPDSSLVTYLYPGDADTTEVSTFAGPDIASGKPISLRRFEKSNLFYYSQVMPKDGRFAYTFNVTKTQSAGGVTWNETKAGELDAFNPDKIGMAAIGFQSYLSMPSAPAQPYAQPTDAPKGETKPFTIHSEILKEDRKFWVYTPAGYDSSKPCNLVLLFDGEGYGGMPEQTRMSPQTILDNMIARNKLGPTICVMIANQGERNRDLTCNKPFADFLAAELVPWLRSKYAIGEGPSHVAAAGASFGGLCASYSALTHPSEIGNALSLSGSYWVTTDWQKLMQAPIPPKSGQMIDWVESSPRVPVKLFVEVGRWEGSASQLTSNRQFRDVLTLKGYELSYEELNGAHQPSQWQGALSDGLIYLFGSPSKK